MMAQLMRRATEAHEGLSPSVISKPVQKEDEEPELDDAAVAKAVADIIAAGDNPIVLGWPEHSSCISGA
jgi:hypothetical protein